ncbi:hypothetical protein [Halorubrum amylolyticum]|uniref:hypothetical protein n=1 Tax=Halorubrum amylolyticum TaxID=2508724 RepID=UPI001009241F|nr:hypothetical protein [Halorubrum amylolyticum]
MTTPNRGRENGYRRRIAGAAPDADALYRFLECLVGGGAAAVLFLLSLPALVELTSPLRSLSPMGLVFAFLFVWLALWAVIGTSRERMNG